MYTITVNFKNNKDFLATVEHERFLDLAVAKIENIEDYADKFKGWIEPDNMYSCSEMNEFGFPDDVPMRVVTNKNRVFGATAITDTAFLSEVHTRFGDFYIIPCSIHELIILSCKDFPDKKDVEAIKNMINEVNHTEVSPYEVLSDNLYKFDGKKVAIVE